MPQARYPFIDLAVHAAIRDRFAAGEAVAVLSPDLGDVLWANGAAARLFGYSSIYELLEGGIDGQSALARQVQSAVGGLSRSQSTNFMMRVAAGFKRIAVPARVEHLDLGRGEKLILLSGGQADAAEGDAARARSIISGFNDTDTHVAVLDADSNVLAASPSFTAIGLSVPETQRMVRDVAHDKDRMVKRMIQSARGPLPAAIGRLTDDPALHLLFVVEPAESEDDAHDEIVPAAAIADAKTDEPASSEPTATEINVPAPTSAGETAVPSRDADGSTAETSADADPGEETDSESDEDEADIADLAALDGVEFTDINIEAPPSELPDADASQAEVDDEVAAYRDEPLSADEPDAATDRLNLQADEHIEPAAVAETEQPEFRFDPNGRPGRFVWKIDRHGAFSEVSPDFAAAVGPNAADIIGRKFPDIARVFNMDRDHVITDLLSRRDTWSGKTVYWPIQGTELAAPVDLAALPTYTRDRQFDGFRGFGIVRPSEARRDPEALGLALVPGATLPEAIDEGIEIDELSADAPDAYDKLAAQIAESTAPTGAEEDNLSDTDESEAPVEPVSVFDANMTPEVATVSEVDSRTSADIDTQDEDAAAEEAPKTMPTPVQPADQFRGEVPAIHVVPNAGRRENDKIIDLGERRARARDGLSPQEQAAFQEIGVRLIDVAKAEAAKADASKPEINKTADTDQADTGSAAGVNDLFSDLGPAAAESPAADSSATAKNEDASTDQAASADSTGEPDQPWPTMDAGDVLPDPDSQDDSREETLVPDPADRSADNENADVADDTAPLSDERDSNIDEVFGPGVKPADQEDIPQGEYQAANDDDTAMASPITEEDEGETAVPSATDDDASVPIPVSAVTPSAFALPSRQAMPAGLTEQMVDAIPAALLFYADDGLLHANPEFLALTGYRSTTDLADNGGLDQLLDQPEADDRIEDGIMLMRRADGGQVPVSARLRSVNWHDTQALMLALSPASALPGTAIDDAAEDTASEPQQTLGIVSDPIAESNDDRRVGMLEIEASELRSILETATDGVVILRADGSIRSMNRSACALFNYDEQETRGKPFAMLFAHESQRAVMDYLSGLANHGVSSVLNDGREVIGREAAGGFLPLFMTMGHLTGSKGYCAVLRDITQWKRSEEELRTAKRAAETANSHKSDFLARVSHEIRTPLNAIIGFSEMMSEERFGPIGSPRYLEYAHDIGNSGKHVLDIVNDLLDISKIEAGQVDLEFTAVALNDHLAECVSMLQPMANSQRVIIRTSLSATVPEVVADQRSIKQIALNLLSNAIRYTPSGGQIVVSTGYEQSGSVVLRIRDTGIGMGRKELEQAMKPFGQVGPGPRQRGDGTGLGLPLTKAMVESNRAQFDIVSTPGEGTLVTITFPPQRVLAD